MAPSPVPAAPTKPSLTSTVLLRPVAVPQKAGRAFELEIIESSGAMRYRDALRRRDEEAFIVMTDFANPSHPRASELLARLQKIVRGAVMTGASPEVVLGLMNRELSSVQLEASATCARLDVRARTITIASAGGPPPFILHANRHVSRVRAVARNGLGLGIATSFEQQVLPFGLDEVLLLGSSAWTAPLERMFAAPIDLALRTLDFALRERRAQPAGGCLVRLTMHRHD